MGASVFRLCAWACPAFACAALSAADGPATSGAPVAAGEPATASAPTTSSAPSLPIEVPTPTAVLGDPAFRHNDTITKAMVLSDGRRLLTSGNDGTVRLWDLPTGRQLQCYRHAKDYVSDFLLLPGEEKLLTAGEEPNVVLWDLKTARRLAEFPHEKTVLCLAVDANATRLAAGDQSGHCIVWDLASKRELARFDLASPSGNRSVLTVLFGPDGNSVIAGCDDSTIRSWDLDTRREKFLKPKDRRLKLVSIADTGRIHMLAPSPDGRCLAVCCSERGPWLMDASSGRQLWEANDSPSVDSAAWSPDGNRIAVAGDENLWVLDANSGATLWKVDLAGSAHYGVAWSKGGSEILCGSDNVVCRFAAVGGDAGKRVYPPGGAPLQNEAVSAGLPSPDGERIYECGSSPGIRVWDRARRAVKETWLEKEDVRGLALSADGLTLAAGAGSFVTAIDTRTGKEIHRTVRESACGNIALTPDGKMMVLSSVADITVLRAATGETVFNLTERTRGDWGSPSLLSASLSEDMELAVTSDGQIRVYKLPGGELIQDVGGAGRHATARVSNRAYVAASEGENEEYFAGCAFVPGEASYLLTWSDKRLHAWTPTPTEANVLSAAEVAALVEQLNADTFRDREAATKKLVAGGRAILPLLRAAQPKEAEQKTRIESVQTQILAAGKLRCVAKIDLPEGATHSFALHPDGRHWALVRGDVSNRVILIGEFSGGELRLTRRLQPAAAPSTVAFDKSGALIVGNCNGTISEYALQPSSQPGTAPGKEGEK